MTCVLNHVNIVVMNKKENIMQTKEDLKQIEQAAHKIDSLANILFCYTQDFESGCPKTTAHINMTLEYMLEEIKKITRVF